MLCKYICRYILLDCFIFCWIVISCICPSILYNCWSNTLDWLSTLLKWRCLIIRCYKQCLHVTNSGECYYIAILCLWMQNTALFCGIPAFLMVFLPLFTPWRCIWLFFGYHALFAGKMSGWIRNLNFCYMFNAIKMYVYVVVKMILS